MIKQERFVLVVSMFVLLLSIVGYFSTSYFYGLRSEKKSNLIGIVTELSGDSKVRYTDDVTWRDMSKSQKVYSYSYVYSGEDSKVTLAFLDQSSIAMGEKSLIFLNFRIHINDSTDQFNDLSLDVVKGSVDVGLRKNSNIKDIKINDVILVTNDLETQISIKASGKNGMNVSLLKGEVDVKSNDENYNIKSGEKIEVVKNKNPKKEKISQKILDKMKKIYQSEQERIRNDIRKKRSISYISKEILKDVAEVFRGLFSSTQ
jgi:hypothetical protein